MNNTTETKRARAARLLVEEHGYEKVGAKLRDYVKVRKDEHGKDHFYWNGAIDRNQPVITIRGVKYAVRELAVALNNARHGKDDWLSNETHCLRPNCGYALCVNPGCLVLEDRAALASSLGKKQLGQKGAKSGDRTFHFSKPVVECLHCGTTVGDTPFKRKQHLSKCAPYQQHKSQGGTGFKQ